MGSQEGCAAAGSICRTVGLALSLVCSEPCLTCSSVCPQQNHVKEALPQAMVTRLFNGMWKVTATHKVHVDHRHISREQFTAFLSRLLKGTFEEKGHVVMQMISTAEGPVKARDVQKVDAWCPGVGDLGQLLR